MQPVGRVAAQVVIRIGKERKKMPLNTPWSQKDSTRPIYDSTGRVVSFTVHAPRIVEAMNLAESIASFNEDGSEVDGEIGHEQAVQKLVEWIERAKAIVRVP